MIGPTPQERMTDLYVALGMGLLGFVVILTALVLARGQARGRARLALAGLACLEGSLVAVAVVRLIGIHAGTDTTDLALAIEFGGVCVAGVFYVALWVRRRRERSREGQR